MESWFLQSRLDPSVFPYNNEMMNDDEQDSFHVTAELTKAQRAAVTCPGSHSLQAEELGRTPRTVGPQSPQASPLVLSPLPGLGREVLLSFGAAQYPSSLRQVPELLCHQSEPHGCDPGPLGSSTAG